MSYTNNNIYTIKVSMNPDTDMGKTPYFWVLLKMGKNDWYNDGCGWSESPEKAFKDANEYYKSKINEDKINKKNNETNFNYKTLEEFFKDFKENNIAVHCDEQWKVNIFIETCINNKIKNIDSFCMSYFITYEKDTCFSYDMRNNMNLYDLFYCNNDYYKKNNYKIIEFDDLYKLMNNNKKGESKNE